MAVSVEVVSVEQVAERPTAQQIGAAIGCSGAAAAQVWGRYRSQAKRHGRAFTLDEDQFDALISSPCHYCGAEPSNVQVVRDSGVTFRLLYSGIDRVDNARGYEPDNVVSCCAVCNVAKGDRPAADLVAHAHRIAERHP